MGAAVTRLGPVLVTTKLHVPEARPGFVPRPELVARLVAGASGRRKLTLLCAPAGWGKTILLSEWSASPDESRSFAWVSLDPEDDDPVRFWAYVIGALRTVEPGVGNEALARLPSAGRSLAEVVLPPLINELAGSSMRCVLVLDDYHVVESREVHDAVAFLLDHLPENTGIAITTRVDPPLPVARLRTRGELLELRAADLRFTPPEAATFLNHVTCLDLEPGHVGALETRTE